MLIPPFPLVILFISEDTDRRKTGVRVSSHYDWDCYMPSNITEIYDQWWDANIGEERFRSYCK